MLKRYDAIINKGMEENANGDWVRYEDIDMFCYKVCSLIDEMHDTIAELEDCR